MRLLWIDHRVLNEFIFRLKNRIDTLGGWHSIFGRLNPKINVELIQLAWVRLLDPDFNLGAKELLLPQGLIDAVIGIARDEGSSRIYWNTDSTNETARKLYDTYTEVSGKVSYRIQLLP